MPVLYVPKQAAKANSAGKKLFYPRVQLTGNVNTDQVAREIAQLSSLTSGDVKNVIDNLVTVVARHLQSSESVTLNGFGSFRYTLVKDSEGVETAEEVTPSQLHPRQHAQHQRHGGHALPGVGRPLRPLRPGDRGTRNGRQRNGRKRHRLR